MQGQLEATKLTSQPAGTGKLCRGKLADPLVLKPKKTRLFWGYRRNFRLGLSAFAVIGAINSASKSRVLHRIKSFRNIFVHPCVCLVCPFKKLYFTNTRRLFVYPV